MRSAHRLSGNGFSALLAVGLLLGSPAQGWSQSIAATLPVSGRAVAINRATNKIYVAGDLAGVVTVVDGKTRSITTVPAGRRPFAVAVNEATNKIYVANIGRRNMLDPDRGSVIVIDGATNSTKTITDPNAHGPRSLAVNPSTNKIYVANDVSGNVTVIDGVTNSTKTVTDPNADRSQYNNAVAVNPTTNRIYVANGQSTTRTGNVTVIDGASNSTTTVSDPHAVNPAAVAVNAVTNRVYVANNGNGGANHGNVTVIDGDTNATHTVADPHADLPIAVTLDSTTDRIYVANVGSHNITVIDGASNSTTTLTDPNGVRPSALAVNETTDTVYVANAGCVVTLNSGCVGYQGGSNPGSITVIHGATGSMATIINPKANAPGAIAVDSRTDQIYVENSGSGNLTIVDGGGTPTTHTLAVVLSGSGSGTVTSSPVGIDCGVTCADSYAIGTAVKLTASAASGSYFSGWSGPCAGRNSCDLVTNKDQFVTATFSPPVAVPESR